MFRTTAIVTLVMVLLLPQRLPAQAGAAAELGASLVALQQLKAQLDSVVSTVDTETAARIKQAEIALDQTISKVKDAMDHGYGLINNTRDQVMGNIAAVMVQTQEMIQGTTGFVLLGVNDSLANVARIVTSIPGVNVPTYVYAVTPLRFPVNAPDPLVQIHGFFPDVSKDHPVKVLIDDGTKNGVTLQLDQYVNNTLAFKLPSASLSREEQFVTMTFDLPVKHLMGAYYTTTSQKARAYVERTTPFTFAISINIENPELWASVTAPSPLAERADSTRTENNQTFTAPAIFSRLVNDNTTYDMSTAQFASFGGVTLTQGVNPCASGCTASSGSWSYDANTVTIALHAPSCPTHVISPGFPQIPYQCGGGTHADFAGTPVFRVKRRNVQQLEAQASSQNISLRRKSVSPNIPLPANWTSIEIRGAFKDGRENYENHARLTSGPAGILSANEAIFWKAEVSGQSLVISTR